jgi:transmembrane sensor
MTDLDHQGAELDPIRREALAWVEQLVSGEATLADAEAMKRWRAQSPAHAAALAEAVRLRRALAVAVQELEQEPAFRAASKRFPDAGKLTRRRLFLSGALAASAAGTATYLVARPPFGLWPSFVALTADYHTGTGEQRDVPLAAGVSIVLNTQTSIAVRSRPNQPGIELLSGEALVASERAPEKPCTVIAGNGRTMAGAAKFDVRYDGASACVTCLEGTVEVEQQGRSLTLPAKHQVTYGAAGLGPVVPVDPMLVAGWREGLLVFHNEPLSRVIDEVNRYRPGRIILASSDLARRRVNASFQLDRLGEVPAQVQTLAGASVTSLPGGIVILH